MARWRKEIVFEKDPSDVVDYELDFSGLLQSDSISTATSSVEEGNVTVDSTTVTGNKVSVFISGGSAGVKSKVTMTIVTTNATPRTYERSFYIRVLNL